MRHSSLNRIHLVIDTNPFLFGRLDKPVLEEPMLMLINYHFGSAFDCSLSSRINNIHEVHGQLTCILIIMM